MSGIETLLASAYTALTTAGTAAGTAAAGTTAATAAGTAAGAAGAGLTAAEVAALAGGTAEALAGAGIASGFAPAASAGLTTAASAGLTTAELISAGSSLAGAGAQLLTKTPSIDIPKPPTRDEARAAADRNTLMAKRRGRGATLLTSPQGVASSPTLGAPSLTGTG